MPVFVKKDRRRFVGLDWVLQGLGRDSKLADRDVPTCVSGMAPLPARFAGAVLRRDPARWRTDGPKREQRAWRSRPPRSGGRIGPGSSQTESGLRVAIVIDIESDIARFAGLGAQVGGTPTDSWPSAATGRRMAGRPNPNHYREGLVNWAQC